MSQTNPYVARAVKAHRARLPIIIILLLALLCGLVFGIRGCMRDESSMPDVTRVAEDAKQQQTAEQANQAVESPESAQSESGGEGISQSESLAVQPTATKKPSGTSAPKVKLLPIIYRKADAKDMIAITIDDCFDADIMRKIIKLAEDNKADLTFFPKGNTIVGNADLWREIYEKGYEIENHTHTHTNVSKLSEANLKKNIQDANDALNEVLGINYHMRLFRCPTGDGMRSAKLHRVLRELNYEAVASWGLSGTQKADKTIRQARPGQLILFHATAEDYQRLREVLPALAKKYKLVSVNTLYGKGPNEVTELAK